MVSESLSLNPVAELVGGIRRVGEMYTKDLKALNENAYSSSFAGVARSPQDFTAEVVGYNRFVAAVVKGETPAQRSDEERAAFAQSLGTREAGAAAVIESCDMVASAIEANSARLSEMTTAPWGEPMSLYRLCMIVFNHISYHDGQLTYLQSLHGDGEMHWFDA